MVVGLFILGVIVLLFSESIFKGIIDFVFLLLKMFFGMFQVFGYIIGLIIVIYVLFKLLTL